MKLEIRQTGTWQRTLGIEVPAEDVDRKLDEAARRTQRRVKLPGFRPGRVPLEIVKQRFAPVVEQELLDDLLPKVITEAVAEAGLEAVVPPLVRDLRFTPGSPLRFEALVDIRPRVEAGDYRGLTLTRRSRPVDEAAVERVLSELREESAVFVDLDRPAERGDVVLLDSTRLDANGRRLSSSRVKNRRIEVGSPGVPPDLENGLLGAQAGQERTVEIRYPDDYSVPDLAGKTARYVIHVRKIQEKKLRELDDNLAREVFRLDSLEGLRSRIRQNLEGEESVRVRRELESAITDELLRRHPIELPERLVQWTLDQVIAEAAGVRTPPEDLRNELEKRYRPGVERSLKREILLDAVARREQIEVNEEEVAQEIDRMAQADSRHASRVRARYQSAERRRGLREALRERKALDWIIQAANVRDETVSESRRVVPANR